MKSIYKDWNKLSKNERSLIMHKDFRNNPNKKGYGSFTGEDGVENYYKIEVKNLKEGDMVVFYSDGFFELLEDKNFIRILRGQNREELDGFVMQKAKENEKYGDDRTFVSVIF
jgi:serine/threonine protein phosphatase PrpC